MRVRYLVRTLASWFQLDRQCGICTLEKDVSTHIFHILIRYFIHAESLIVDIK